MQETYYSVVGFDDPEPFKLWNKHGEFVLAFESLTLLLNYCKNLGYATPKEM